MEFPEGLSPETFTKSMQDLLALYSEERELEFSMDDNVNLVCNFKGDGISIDATNCNQGIIFEGESTLSISTNKYAMTLTSTSIKPTTIEYVTYSFSKDHNEAANQRMIRKGRFELQITNTDDDENADTWVENHNTTEAILTYDTSRGLQEAINTYGGDYQSDTDYAHSFVVVSDKKLVYSNPTPQGQFDALETTLVRNWKEQSSSEDLNKISDLPNCEFL